VVNHGLIDAGGVNATGLFLLAHTEVVNTGQIAVEASDLAQAIQDASGMSDIRNSGVIQAVDLDGADSRAILFIGGADSAVIENSGVISADTAIWVTQALAGTSIDITNSGQIFGKILLAAGDDLLDNSGAIVGDVDLGDGHDLFRGGKGQLDGALSGGGGADQLFGGAASELIYGDGLVADSSDGTDLLKGGHGDDTLIGGGGDDTLRGGADGDHLTGGAGSDVFLFAKLSDSAWSAPDLITDLEATDVIDISGIDADTTQAGDQAFHLVHALSGQAGEAALSYDRATHLTRLELDVDGDGHADAVIAIDGDRSDFTNFVL
jgi:serralysin